MVGEVLSLGEHLERRTAGRPRLSDDQSLRVKMSFRCSELAAEELERAARENFCTVSEFVEQAVASAIADYRDGARFNRRAS